MNAHLEIEIMKLTKMVDRLCNRYCHSQTIFVWNFQLWFTVWFGMRHGEGENTFVLQNRGDEIGFFNSRAVQNDFSIKAMGKFFQCME